MHRSSLVALALLVAACAGAEKRGDRAASIGDWKAAERHYAEALQKQPGNPQRKDKWQRARQNALQGAVAAARACQGARDWECAYAESEYAARLDPASAEIAALRGEAGRNLGLLRIRAAEEASGRRDHKAAFELYDRARSVTADPGVQAEASRIVPSLVRAAVEDAQRQRAAQQYPGAIELLTLAANVDGRARAALDETRAEYDRWLGEQYEREAKQGDALLRERRFADAQARYAAALKHRQGGRAEPLERYARALSEAEQAVQRRDWQKAAAAYDEAAKTGVDQYGFAASELERVRIRPYVIRVRSVLVKPVRPDGLPWAGGRTREFDRFVGKLSVAAAEGSRRGPPGVEAYDSLPQENRPEIYASMTLPDGREYATEPQRALRARLESWVVMNTNAYDDRPVTVRILHTDRVGTYEVGAVSFRLMDALANELRFADRSVAELRVVAEPSPLRDGQTEGFTRASNAPSPGPARPPALVDPPRMMVPRTPAN